jgi:hypothetical protein
MLYMLLLTRIWGQTPSHRCWGNHPNIGKAGLGRNAAQLHLLQRFVLGHRRFFECLDCNDSRLLQLVYVA